MDSKSDAHELPERIGPYRIEDRLGAGGMGEVYRAYDERLHRRVAIKRILLGEEGDDSNRRERLRREARSAARLSHPAVTQIYDILETEEGDCIVMELVEGETLAALLHQGPLEVPRAVSLALEIAEALAAAHSEGIVHRDLKGENVIVTPLGHAKILDFGLAKHLAAGGEGSDASLTADGTVLGTSKAMSPEQAQGHAVDHRSDLFSFGGLLYEMVTGRSPFLATTPVATLSRVCSYHPPPATEKNHRVPDALSELIDRLLAKEPEDRPQSAAATAGSLERIAIRLQGRTVSQMPAGAPGPRRPAADGDEPGHATSSSSGSTGERRQVTVMRCDLAAIGPGPLDPEELFELMPAFHAAASKILDRFGGHLWQTLGNGLVVYFGYPRAHEDDARRAVHAGLALVEAARELPSHGPEAKPSVRVGIHTGPVVMTRFAGSPDEPQVLGDTPDLAAAVHGLAPPGTVLVSGTTLRLVEAFFTSEAAGTARESGGAALTTFRVVEESGAYSRVETAGAGALSALVAREQELSLLLERWELTAEGRGQVVLLSAEAGVGKSRLVRELRQRLSKEGSTWLACHGSPYHQGSVLYPVIDLLQRILEPDPGGSSTAPLERLEEGLSRYGVPLESAVPLLAELMELPLGGRYAPLAASPERKRARTLETVLGLLLAICEEGPLLLVVEDLHWVDPTTLELLGLLLEQGAAARLMVLLSFRPHFKPPWEQRSYFTHLALSPLTRRQVEALVERVAGGRSLPPEVTDHIADKTDGVPLFVEELTKAILESGLLTEDDGGYTLSGPLDAFAIPATLHDSLMARLDRLGPAKEVAQWGATLGRTFSQELLAAVAPWEEEELARELDRLVQAELLHRRGLPGRTGFVFKHALIRDAAYQSLLRNQRRQQHRRIAEVMAARFPELARTQPELLAQHYTEANMPPEAARHWCAAGAAAGDRAANREAIDHLQRGLGLLKRLPEGEERDGLEIELRMNLGRALMTTRGYAAPEVERCFTRARELCQRFGESRRLLPTLWGLVSFYTLRGTLRTARELAAEALELSSPEDDPGLHLNARLRFGWVIPYMGELPGALEHLEQALAPEAPDLLPSDTYLGSLNHIAWTRWFVGLPDGALEASRQAMAFAQERNNPFFIAETRGFLAFLHVYRREVEMAGEEAERLIALCTELGFPFWLAVGQFIRGWAQAWGDDPEEGIAAAHRAISEWRATGAEFGASGQLATLGQVYVRAGKVKEGLAALAAGFAAAEERGETWWKAELHRLRGELLRLQGARETEVEAELLEAVDTSRRQGALALELRAAMSLGRLWADRGEREQARRLLAGVHGRLQEGFELPDLQEAEAALKAWS